MNTEPPKHIRKNGKNPLLIGREPGVWHADLVGLIPGYAATAEGYRRRQEAARSQACSMNANGQRGTRSGVPDGFAGRRAEVEEIKEETRRAAREAVAVLTEHHIVETSTTARAEVEEAFAAAINPTLNGRDKLAALKRVLNLVHGIPEKPRKPKKPKKQAQPTDSADTTD